MPLPDNTTSGSAGSDDDATSHDATNGRATIHDCATTINHTADVLNPFVKRCCALDTTYDIIKVAVMSVCVFPLRVVAVVLCIVIAWLLACIGLWGITDEQRQQPFTGWKRFMRWYVLAATRCVFLAAGFPWVRERGARASSADAPVLVVAPHSSYFDVLPVVAMLAPSVVAKGAFARTPFFGKLIDYTQPVYVSREDPDSRQNTIKEIQRRVESKGAWPQILLFPEGTCTNRSCLIQFKPGAFYPGVPVQPVIIRYPNRLDTFTWTWEGPSALKLMWLTLSQFVNYCEIEYLPVYHPSDAERSDPRLFACNVRQVMADALGVPITDFTYDDCRLMSKARSKNLPCETGLVEVSKLCHRLGINMATIESQLDSFAQMARQTDGRIRLSEFSEYLGIPTGEPALVELFNLYDADRDGVIDFREYLLGVCLISRPCNTEDTIALAFRLFDRAGSGHVTAGDLATALGHTLNMTSGECGRIFSQVDKKDPRYITFDEFRAHAQKKPEYAKIFLSWHGRMNKQDKHKSA